MRLKDWRARLRKQETELFEANEAWKSEYKKLCVLAEFEEPEFSRDWQTRQGVFAIADIGARKSLIAHFLKLHSLALRDAELDVSKSELRVAEAGSIANNWWYVPALNTVLYCIVAAGLVELIKLPGAIGAIAAAACGILMGINYRDNCLRDMRDAVRSERAELRTCKDMLDRFKRDAPMFSEEEAENGVPEK